MYVYVAFDKVTDALYYLYSFKESGSEQINNKKSTRTSYKIDWTTRYVLV